MSKVGIVKRWDEERGFGFIGQEGGQSDIFVHRTCLVGMNALQVNDRVFYEAIYDDKKSKFQAISCSMCPPTNELPPLNGLHHGSFSSHHGSFAQQQPIPVHFMQMQSPNGMTPMSSPGTPPNLQMQMVSHNQGYMTPPAAANGQQFLPTNFMPPVQPQNNGGSPNQFLQQQMPHQQNLHSPNGMTPQSGGPSPNGNMQQFW